MSDKCDRWVDPRAISIKRQPKCLTYAGLTTDHKAPVRGRRGTGDGIEVTDLIGALCIVVDIVNSARERDLRPGLRG